MYARKEQIPIIEHKVSFPSFACAEDAKIFFVQMIAAAVVVEVLRALISWIISREDVPVTITVI